MRLSICIRANEFDSLNLICSGLSRLRYKKKHTYTQKDRRGHGNLPWVMCLKHRRTTNNNNKQKKSHIMIVSRYYDS